MLLENGLKFKKFQKFEVSHIAERLSQIDDGLWYQIPKNNKVLCGLGEAKLQELINDKKTMQAAKRLHIICSDDDFIPRKMKYKFGNPSYSDLHSEIKSLKRNHIDDKLNEYTEEIVDVLEKQFDGYIGRVLYSNLFEKRMIDWHIDMGEYVDKTHRLHIPIITNDHVKFCIQDTVLKMETGVLYEVNNKIKHCVINDGATGRINLILDIIPKDVYPK